MAKTVLVTGASSGIGKATAVYLAQHGYNVYGAARRVNRLQELSAYGVKPVALDITSEDSIAKPMLFLRGLLSDKLFDRMLMMQMK
jgi:NADP-dependent 3-hydroxy acid dehydrogenase YdfG